MIPGRSELLRLRVAGSARLWAIVAVNLATSSCGRPERAADAVFQVDACGEAFSIALSGASMIARASEFLSAGRFTIVTGQLAHGDGGFNAPWSWHLRPETVSFVDASVEVCDGCPRMVENDLAYWVDNLGRFCPGGRVTKRIR